MSPQFDAYFCLNTMSPLQGSSHINMNFIGLTAYALKYHPFGVYHSYSGLFLQQHLSPEGATLHSVAR